MPSVRQLAGPGTLSAWAGRLGHSARGAISLRQLFATDRLQKAYVKGKGFSSPVGMLLVENETRDKPVSLVSGSRYVAQFRSGNLVLNSLDGPVATEDTHEVQINLVAIECVNKQEKEDELVGSVAWIKPSDKTSGVFSIPKIKMGKGGERILTFNQTIYQGAFANINLSLSLVEKDSGDTTKYREALAREIQKAAMVGGAALGVGAETLAGGEPWMRTVSLGISNVIFDVLGADDDEYSPVTFEINWKEMVLARDGQLQPQTLRRDDDPDVVQYTHKRPVTGVDDGGDAGHYNFYFMVRTMERKPINDF